MADDRKFEVLRAIIEDYVATSEPVGSKALVERHHLGVSPATVRNDMAALEDEGYLTQPHTSAGRVPTDAGYRLFVDRLSSVKPMSGAERSAIQTFLSGAVDLDDVVLRTVRLLAQLTRQVAVVQYPSLTRSRVRHVELLSTGPRRLMVVVITTTGRVEQRVIDMPVDLDEAAVGELRSRLNHAASGQLITEVPAAVDEVVDAFGPEARPAVAAVVTTLLESLVEESEERVVLAGTSNLALFGADFHSNIQPVLEALEEQVVLLHLLGEASTPSQVHVRIGHELPVERLTSTSLVSTGYGESSAGRLGVLGPTRMDYPSTMAAVSAVARYVGRHLEQST